MLVIVLVFALIYAVVTLLEKPLVKKIALSKTTFEAISNRRKLIAFRLGLSILLFSGYLLLFLLTSDLNDPKTYEYFMQTLMFIFIIGVQQYGFKGLLGNISCLSKSAFLSAHEKFVLFLRGFNDDDYSKIADIPKDNFDEFSEYGFMSLLGAKNITACAVGMTKEADSPIGAKRIYVDDSSWKEDVKELIEKSETIFILVRDRESCIWEIETAIAHLEKVKFIIDDIDKYNNVRETLKNKIDLPEITDLIVGSIALISCNDGKFNVALYSNSIDGYARILDFPQKKLNQFKKKYHKNNKKAINLSSKKTIKRALIGILITFVLLVAIDVGFKYYEEKERTEAILTGEANITETERQELIQELKQEFRKFSTTFPLTIDENTILKKADINDTQLTLEYEIVGLDADELNMGLIKLGLIEGMKKEQLGLWCSLNIELVYRYNVGDEVKEIVFTKEDLNTIHETLQGELE